MAFWKPGTLQPGSSVDRSTESEGVFDSGITSSLASQNASLSPSLARTNLPIFKQRDTLLYLVENHPVLVVVGQTGCGKTTQIPQYLFEAGWAADGHQIACTQPRRVAATSVAERVAQEVGTILGQEVGYTIRFEDCSSPSRTRIKYLTDGMLFRECMRDPLLSKYSVIMVDEAHERSAYTDLLLAILKKIQRKRPELRIIISSATIDANAFADFFSPDVVETNHQNSTQTETTRLQTQQNKPAAILSLQGRLFPVEIAYTLTSCADYVQAAVEAVWSIHLGEPAGDVLVFLTGREEIDVCLQALADRSVDLPFGSPNLVLLPLHAGCTREEQADVFKPTPRDSRKVIVATNIAEASVTIDGIKYVVDCGFVKLKTFNPETGMDVLSVVPESLASATQRAGRAGRTSLGKCFRLFPEEMLSCLAPTTLPELCRSDLTVQLLQLKALGIDNLARFEFLPPSPPTQLVARGLELLASLGALDQFGRLTHPLGENMAEAPLDPTLAKVLISSANHDCTNEILSILAMVSVSSPFLGGPDHVTVALHRRPFAAQQGDHLTLLNVYTAFTSNHLGKSSAKWAKSHGLNFTVLSRAINIRNQLAKYLVRFQIPSSSNNNNNIQESGIRKCLVNGYFQNVIRFHINSNSWIRVRDSIPVTIDPRSVLYDRSPSSSSVSWAIYHDMTEIGDSRIVREVTLIQPDWLTEIAPHYYEFTQRSSST